MPTDAQAPFPKEATYYAGANEHLLDLLPEDARRILDVGCGRGALGRLVKEARPDAVVHGLDREPAAIRAASAQLDRVYTADLDAGLPSFDASYDCILCGDVLEHLVDPWSTLRRLAGALAAGGHLLASIPNVRYYKVLRALVLHGRFTYRERGILDITHLRFFTLREMKDLFVRAGLEVIATRPRLGGRNVLLRLGDAFLGGRLEEFRAVQYVLVGRNARTARAESNSVQPCDQHGLTG